MTTEPVEPIEPLERACANQDCKFSPRFPKSDFLYIDSGGGWEGGGDGQGRGKRRGIEGEKGGEGREGAEAGGVKYRLDVV